MPCANEERRMSSLDPRAIFSLLAREIPQELHEHILVIGSLAAAYAYRERLPRRAVNTKDADVVVRPAGALKECREIATTLLANGWMRREGCRAQPTPGEGNDHEVIRLCPPSGNQYFLELLGFPEANQTEPKRTIPVELDDGWYVLPTFRYLRFLALNERTSEEGIRYADPSMMALANLLAHPEIGTRPITEPIGGRRVLRSAKDLGRVLALTRLAHREEVEAWVPLWHDALRACHAESEANQLASRVGDGLGALVNRPDALEDARHAVDVGLLNGFTVTHDVLRALVAQLLADAIEPLRKRMASAVPGARFT